MHVDDNLLYTPLTEATQILKVTRFDSKGFLDVSTKLSIKRHKQCEDNEENRLGCVDFSTDICSGMVHLWFRKRDAGGVMRNMGKSLSGLKVLGKG